MNDATPRLDEIEGFTVTGLSVRTINSDEFNQKTAKLPQLWETFLSRDIANKIPNRSPMTPIFGVYSNYDSDATDFYTVTAGVQVIIAPVDEELSTVHIQSGSYLVFKDKGTIPDVLIKTWERIWLYFEEHEEYKRNYRTDFETYLGPDEIAIYIGITD